MSFEIRPATRTGVKPLIGLFSESGCGKTYSSLLLARGFVGPAGKIVMIDTESGRGSLYADVILGGYEVLELREPFSPTRYIEAIQAVELSGAGIGIIDSCSHEWEGLGGVLDMAGQAEAKSGKPGLHNWRAPKMEHAKFMLKLLQSPLPWICCLRAKHKTRQTKQDGRTAIVKDDFTTPLTSDDFIFEMVCHGEIMQDHSFRLTKCSHPSLRQAMPNNEPIANRHGELLAAWCAVPGASKPAATDDAKLKKELWAVTKSVHGGEKGKLLQWLIDEALVDPSATLDELAGTHLQAVLTNAKKKLNP